MFDCRKARSLFPEVLWGDAPADRRARLDAHLARCGRCRAEFEAQAAALARIGGALAPAEPGSDYWAGYWDRLQDRMAAEWAATPAARRPFPRLALRLALPVAAAAMLLIVGIWIGRGGRGPAPVGPGMAPGLVQASDVSDQAVRYLERSQRIILSFVSYDPAADDPSGLDLPAQKRLSRDLVSQAAVLKDGLKKSRQRKLESLVAELESILIQIANLDEKGSADAIDVVKAGAASNDILFKINLAQIRGSSSTPRPKAL